ncbi:MAG: dioxygenase [Gammaproteobacteria bacterium]|nr:dioxygenase [Gammaproteobacteria bacterium]
MPAAPVIFVSHGAPTLALDQAKGAPLVEWGKQLPRPSAVLTISAHWVAPTLTVGARSNHSLLYDFYGFPAPLYNLRYPAPGAPELADRVSQLLAESGTEVKSEPSRGFDHGVWVPLLRLFPEADIPVLQLAQPAPLQPDELFRLGQQLAPLRNEGVLILASGSLTHNLYQFDPSERSVPPDWAVNFDSWAREVVQRRDWSALLNAATSAPDFATAHPTPEHFSPLWLAAGASRADDPLQLMVEGFEFGSISRLSLQFG